MVRVRGWVMHYAYGRPHKDKSPRMCVCVCVLVGACPLARGHWVTLYQELPPPLFMPLVHNPDQSAQASTPYSSSSSSSSTSDSHYQYPVTLLG